MIGSPEINRAYDVRATVGPEAFAALMARYRAESERATAGLGGHPGVVYDERSGEQLDVWGVGSDPRPAFVFLHGGYWRVLGREDSAFMARMLAGHGIATVAVDYTLAPAATLEEIVRQVRAAVAWVHRAGAAHGLDPRRIVVGGSSAGGHLAAMLLLDGWQAPLGLPGDAVAAAMPFSGLFDLRPIVDSYVNEWLGLDDARARALSPLLRLPRRATPVVAAVAEHDGDGFLEQSRRFHDAWRARFPGAGELLVARGRNHFDVVLDLVAPDTAVSRALVELIRGTAARSA